MHSEARPASRLQPGGASYFQMREDDVQRVLQFEATMIGSDGLPHDRIRTRAYGARFRACSDITRANCACSRWRRQCTA